MRGLYKIAIGVVIGSVITHAVDLKELIATDKALNEVAYKYEELAQYCINTLDYDDPVYLELIAEDQDADSYDEFSENDYKAYYLASLQD